MKKILVTTLALSLAVVSMVDAYKTGAPAVSDRQIAQNVSNAAKDLKAAPMSEKDAAFQDLMASLEADPKMADLARLETERKKIVTDLEDANARLKELKTGWFFQSKEYDDQRKIVSKLNTKLKDTNKEIAAARKELPRESIVTVNRAVIAAVAAVGVLAVLEYWYMGEESRVKAGIAYGTAPFREGGYVRTKAQEFQEGYFPERFGGKPVVKETVTP